MKNKVNVIHKFNTIVLIIVFLGLLTFTGIGTFYFYNGKSYVFNLASKSLNQAANSYYLKINQRIDTAEFYLKLAAKHHKNFKNILPFINDRNTYKHVFFLNSKGKVIKSTKQGFTTSAFKNELSKDLFVSVKAIGGADLAIAVPIKNSNLWIGGVISLEVMLGQDNESLFLYSPENLLIYSTGKYVPSEIQFQGKLIKSNYGDIIISNDGNFFGKHVNLKHGFSLNLIQSSKQAYTRLHTSVRENLLFFLLIYAIIAFIVLFLIKKLLNSVNKANKSLEEANLSMEEKVKQRTLELTELNTSLVEEIDRRIQTEKWLAESEERYKLALTATNEGNWEYTKKTQTCYFSDKWFELLAYKPNDLPHTFDTWLNLMHPDDRPSFKNAINEAFENGKEFEVQYRLKSKNNNWVWILNKGIVARNDDGEVEKLIGTNADITARKQAEEALKESEERFALFVDFIPAMVYIKETDSSLVYVNRYMQRFLGTENWKGKYPEDLYLPEFALKIKKEDQQALRNGVINDVVNEYVSYGSKRVYQTHKFAIKRHGKPDLIGGISLDITEKQIAEDERKQLEIAIQQATETVIITDVLDKITYVNSAFEKTTGYEKDKVIGKTVSAVTGRHLKPELWKDIWNEISAGKTYKGIISSQCVDGTILQEETTITPIKNAFGIITNYVYVKRNITEKQKLEHTLLKAQKLEAIGTLAGGIAHDFNNILAIISGFTELIQLKTENKTGIEQPLDEIQNAAVRAKKLIKQILTFSSGSQKDQSIKPLKISEIVTNYLPMLKSSLPLAIEIQTFINSSKEVSVDETEVQQILMNLVTNAYHAIGKAGQITINVKDVLKTDLNPETAKNLNKNSYTMFEVKDNGCGISKQNISKIFDPYFTTKPQGSGTGLGLSIIHGIVKGYEGYIEVSSEENKQTSFIVYLPHTEQIAIEDNLQPEETIKQPEKKISIMLVDDDETITKFNSRALQVYGYNVTAFNDSIDALTSFEATPHKFDLIITDMTMPRMTGAELARKAIEVKPDVPIILMTGYSEYITPDEATNMGIKEFVYKPVMVKQLVDLVKKHQKHQQPRKLLKI